VDGTRFPSGDTFPHEAFVQRSIERYFAGIGFQPRIFEPRITDTEIHEPQYTDLVCMHPETGDVWMFEAKGETTAIGLDFATRERRGSSFQPDEIPMASSHLKRSIRMNENTPPETGTSRLARTAIFTVLYPGKSADSIE
jgi:hypothetical protein